MKKYLVAIVLLSVLAGAMLLAASFGQPMARAQGPLAPDGTPRQTYYAPFPLTITLDGDLGDWAGVPTVVMPEGVDLTAGRPAITFAAAADGQYIYFMGDVIDPNLIVGQHDADYWNEDSVEFYVNATGDLKLRRYTDGVAQVTVPAANIGLTPDQLIISGVNGTTVDAKAIVVTTPTGYAVEVAVPLKNNVWDITPAHGGVLGFQVHLNGASSANRDTKLIWSALDTADQSYQNPSLFGKLIFFEIGQTEQPVVVEPTPAPTAIPAPADAPYRNASLPVEERIDDLLARMTLDEKIGQMTQVEKNSIVPDDITGMTIGSVLSGGGGYPSTNSAAAWLDMVNGFQQYALNTRLGIPLIYGVDAIHGHNNVRGATIFPQQVGLGAANDPELMTRIGQATAQEMVATGIYWDFAPVVAPVQDIRWGRAYEAYGENTELVTRLAIPYMLGLQGETLGAGPTSVLATPKHYLGDGGTQWGTSAVNGMLDRGVTGGDDATMRALYLPPYQAAVEAGALSIMPSFSSWGGLKMHAQHYLLTDVLKGELGFQGFLISDWQAIDEISPDYYESVVTSINAGLDMIMVPYNYLQFIDTLKAAVEEGDVSQERIDDAVRRILRAKFTLGLFEHPFGDETLLDQVGSDEHRAIAREAVAKSLVLLKDDANLLPLAKDQSAIFVGGEAAHDIGIQSGGWTIEWQGGVGGTTPGTSIFTAIKETVQPGTILYYDRLGAFKRARDAAGNPLVADIGIAVVGERPYAEMNGDTATLSLPAEDLQMLETMRARCDKLIVILVTGRPVIITDLMQDWDAVIAAWLPGTEGAGVADVLFGDRPFTGKLPYTWPRSADQLPFDFANLGTGEDGPLFPYGYGLE